MNIPEGCSMSLRLGGNYRYPGTSQDQRSLESPTDGDSQRELGVFFTLDPRDCHGTCTIDLDYSPGDSYDLTLYFVDWEKGARRSAIEIFDMNTLEMLAPLVMVREYPEGRYLTLRIDRPIRMRINNIRGDNAALAAMFFGNIPALLGKVMIDSDITVTPGAGKIVVTSNDTASLSLFNIKGEKVIATTVGRGESEISPISEGIYVVNGQKILVY